MNVIFLILTLSFFYILQFIFPLFKGQFPTPFNRRFFTNLGRSLIWLICIQIIMQFVIEVTYTHWLDIFKSSLFRQSQILNANSDSVLYGLVIFLILDYSTYWWHRLNHRISFLRKFHQMHHSDLTVDTTTSFRFHFVELSLQHFYKLIIAFVLKISYVDLVLFETTLYLGGLFHHSSLALPLKLQPLLDKIFVTPRFHFNHHINQKHLANSNYGSLFAVWDHLHSTYTPPVIELSPDQFGAPKSLSKIKTKTNQLF